MNTRTTTINSIELAVTSVLPSALVVFRRAHDRMRTHAERKRSERALRELDPRLLKDIGIDRSEIMSIVYTGGRDRR